MRNPNDNKFSGKVLVLGTDNRAFLAVIRSLGRKDICVHVGWCLPDSQALKSKYVKAYQNIPAFSSSDKWKTVFIEILKRENYDLVIPCNDQSIIPLQLNRDDFEAISRIYLLSDDCYRIANDKFEMQRLAGQLGVNIPQEMEVSKSTNIDHILSKLRMPIVLKPRSSFTQNNLSEKNKVCKVFSVQELQDQLDNLKQDELLCAQVNFIGKGVGVELLVFQGKILYAFQHIRIHEPLNGGGSSYRKSVRVDAELLEASRKIVAALNYTGVAMIEFKMNILTREWVFIEMNARFWGSLPLAVACKADFPYFLYLMLVKGERNFTGKYKKGIYCRNTSQDLAWLVKNIKADHSNVFLETVPIWQVMLEFLNVILFRERNDALVVDDFGPGVTELSDIFLKGYFRIRRTLYSSQIFRVFLKRNALARIEKVETVLFVCKGNICRSPFAHYYLRSILSTQLRIKSCGYYPKVERPCPSEAIAAGKMLGVDLSAHRSSIIDNDMIEWADVIFVFDEENLMTVTKLFPLARTKTIRIGSLDTAGPLEIKDPYSRDLDYFYNTYKEIKKLLDLLMGAVIKKL